MGPWTRGLCLIAGLAAAFVTISSVALAIRQGSWAPVAAVGWLPGVMVASWPGAYRRCLPRRTGQPR
jgi:hypothetical protein